MNISPDIFKAYDIRGRYPSEINEKIVAKISNALAKKYLKTKNCQLKTIMVGHDARLSSPKLYRAVIRNLKTYKLTNLKTIGLATTPMFYFLANHFNADLGIMITASHNPKEYNGLKIVGKKAIPISGKEIYNILRNTK